MGGLITMSGCFAVIMSAHRKAQTMDYKWAYFALTSITLVQMVRARAVMQSQQGPMAP